MEDDWDLQAVVRGCGTTTSSATATATVTASSAASITNTSSCGQLISCNNFHQDRGFSAVYCQDLFEPRRDNLIEELHDLYKPFFPKSKQPAATLQVGGSLVPSPQSLPISPLSVLGGFQDLSSDHHQQQQQQQQIIPQQTQLREKQQSLSVASGSKHSVSSQNPSPRSSKRRKNNLKKVCHVLAESLSSDMWSWRKYGQKPIKGSPYPRGYYKCSTSKGCLARKQVERNRSDPGMFIVTYTAEHNHPMPTHRNSLAGCTRQKPPTTSSNSDDPNKLSCSPENSPVASLSLTPEKLESSREDLIEAEDDDLSVSNMALDEDFFEGLEDFASPDAGECISIHFPASMQIPCLANNTTNTAAGGGGG